MPGKKNTASSVYNEFSKSTTLVGCNIVLLYGRSRTSLSPLSNCHFPHGKPVVLLHQCEGNCTDGYVTGTSINRGAQTSMQYNRHFLAIVAFVAISLRGTCQYVSPQITAVSLASPSALAAGSSVAYNFSVSGNTTSSATFVQLIIQDPIGHTYILYQTDISSGTVSLPTTTSWLDGAYSVAEIRVGDSQGYETFYEPNGQVIYENGGTGPSTSPISLPLLGFTVTGGLATYLSPTLASAGLSSPQTLVAGNTLTYNFTAVPGTDGSLSFVQFLLQDAEGHSYILYQSNVQSGSVSLATTPSWLNGTYSVTEIRVGDPLGYQTFYEPNGQVIHENGGVGPDLT